MKTGFDISAVMIELKLIEKSFCAWSGRPLRACASAGLSIIIVCCFRATVVLHSCHAWKV